MFCTLDMLIYEQNIQTYMQRNVIIHMWKFIDTAEELFYGISTI